MCPAQLTHVRRGLSRADDDGRPEPRVRFEHVRRGRVRPIVMPPRLDLPALPQRRAETLPLPAQQPVCRFGRRGLGPLRVHRRVAPPRCSSWTWARHLVAGTSGTDVAVKPHASPVYRQGQGLKDAPSRLPGGRAPAIAGNWLYVLPPWIDACEQIPIFRERVLLIRLRNRFRTKVAAILIEADQEARSTLQPRGAPRRRRRLRLRRRRRRRRQRGPDHGKTCALPAQGGNVSLLARPT
jgi:hypothetical protein